MHSGISHGHPRSCPAIPCSHGLCASSEVREFAMITSWNWTPILFTFQDQFHLDAACPGELPVHPGDGGGVQVAGEAPGGEVDLPGLLRPRHWPLHGSGALGLVILRPLIKWDVPTSSILPSWVSLQRSSWLECSWPAWTQRATPWWWRCWGRCGPRPSPSPSTPWSASASSSALSWSGPSSPTPGELNRYIFQTAFVILNSLF